MSGDSRIISGVKNKMMIGMSNMMPDSMNAANMADNMDETNKSEEQRRHHSDHPASQQEREMIRDESGKKVRDKK
jgi:uncharacterized protein